MSIKLIWCQDINKGIGKNNTLPWKIKSEMQHFRESTINQIVVMGRKTFESIGKALSNRKNIVLTKNTNYFAEEIEVFHSVQAVLKKYANNDLYIIGGKEIYKIFFALADELIISELKTSYDCDTFLNFDLSKFELLRTKDFDQFSVKYFYFVKPTSRLELNLTDFYGSLDLLWALIKEKKYDIYQLDIKDLTEQYLKFINQQIHRINIDIAAEYLLTASQLIYLKTKMVFNNENKINLSEMNNFLAERDLLIQRLLEYKKIRKGITWLRKKQQTRIKKYIKKPYDFNEYVNQEVGENLYLPKSIDVDKLKWAFEIVLSKMKIRNFKRQQLLVEELSVDQVELELRTWINNNHIKTSSLIFYLNHLDNNKKSLKYAIVVFLVILTLVRAGEIIIEIANNDIHFSVKNEWGK